jgi:hypothetical protein
VQAAGAAEVRAGLYQAARGEVNSVTLTDNGSGQTQVVELTAPLTIGPGCLAGPPVLCDTITLVRLGDRDDRAARFSFFSDGSVYAGPGDDDIHSDGLGAEAFGGEGDDRVGVSSNGFSEATGGPGDDVVTGSGAASVVLRGGPGDDRVEGRAGGAIFDLHGGVGDDTVEVVIGMGTPGTVAGGPGDDSIGATGAAGGAAMTGGSGDDVLAGSAGADTFAAGMGRDRVDSADGTAEPVNCGAGVDAVVADALDTVAANCEQVTIL